MKIHFERSGGFAGIRTELTLDTDSLPTTEAHNLQRMVENSKFFDIPAKLLQPTKGADYFQYKITVEKDGQKHTVEAAELTMKPELKPFVDFLSRALMKKHR
ncbi:MAG: protealysin inhibitor emfourin [Nitrosopumilaceae archaeon]